MAYTLEDINLNQIHTIKGKKKFKNYIQVTEVTEHTYPLISATKQRALLHRT